MSAPLSQCAPTGYTHPGDGTQHVNYVGLDDNHVHELWWNGAWHHADLTNETGAPTVAIPEGIDALTVFGYVHPGDGTQHINFTAAHDGHIHELWWQGGWNHADLTEVTGAPHPREGYGRGYVHPDGTQHIPFLGSDLHIHELWWDGIWHHNDLTVAGGAPVITFSAMDDVYGYVHPGDGTQHVNFRGPDFHLHELWWDGNWHHADLSAVTGATDVFSYGQGYVNTDGTQHIPFLGSDEHVHELWWDGLWHHNDLTIAVGGAPAHNRRKVSGYRHTDGTQHVIYVGSDGHIHHLGWDGDWHHHDLTAKTGAPLAADSSAYGYSDPVDATQHINYLSTDGHVIEFWYDGSWHLNDLTIAAS